MLAAQLLAEAHAERHAVGERARATIERQAGEARRRDEREERERERGY